MKNALIVFASRHGQTESIALRIAKVLSDAGITVDLADVRRTPHRPPLARYEQIIVAGPVYFGRHPRRLERFIVENREAMSTRATALVSVSGSASKPGTMNEAERVVADLLRRTGWTPDRTLLAAGAIPYTRYNFLLRWMMRRIAASQGGDTDVTRDHEYTNWAEVEAFARSFVVAAELTAAAPRR